MYPRAGQFEINRTTLYFDEENSQVFLIHNGIDHATNEELEIWLGPYNNASNTEAEAAA